jgi:hypothetical protein
MNHTSASANTSVPSSWLASVALATIERGGVGANAVEVGAIALPHRTQLRNLTPAGATRDAPHAQ